VYLNSYKDRGEGNLQYHIEGSTMQTLKIKLEPGESIYSESGCLLYMTPEIELKTNFTGGIGGILKRAITGNSLALNHFKAHGGTGVVSFTTRMPGHIVPLSIQEYGSVFVQRHSFLCAQESVKLEIYGNFGLTGFFGGIGLIYNQLEGNGLAFISVDGEVTEHDLQPGETLLIHPGHLAAYEQRVQFEVQRLKGFKNMFFGGDGIFLAKVTGPGKVWMHSLSIHNLAEVLTPYISSEE
jgi:uncharacterized protein (TIGR00266 family)